MMIPLLTLGFILGSALGSFLAVVIDRSARGEQILSGRSKCEHCKKTLGVLDLVPIFSYLLLGGRCRYCHKKIPKHLFILEVVCGILGTIFVYYALSNGLALQAILLLSLIFFSLVGIFLVDLYHGIIPDELVGVIIVSSFALIIASFPAQLSQHLITGFACFALFLFLFLVTRGRGMGFGDVKFSFALGFFLGFPSAVVALYFAFISAAIVSVFLIATGKKKLHGGIIVFGPFLTIGTLVGYLWGNKIVGIFF